MWCNIEAVTPPQPRHTPTTPSHPHNPHMLRGQHGGGLPLRKHICATVCICAPNYLGIHSPVLNVHQFLLFVTSDICMQRIIKLPDLRILADQERVLRGN